MSRWLNRFQPWGILLLRLVLALSMIAHGYQKVVPHGALRHFTQYVTTLGLPYWLGYVSAYTEFVGGILIAVGLLTRFAAALVAVNMLVALVTVGIHQGFGIYNYILELAAIAIMLVLSGPGKASFDRKIGFN